MVTFDQQVRESTFEAVILGASFDFRYYKNRFDPENPENPDCFAMGMTAEGAQIELEDLGPPEDLKTKESSKCKDCWANAFETATEGKGKACSQRIRLALLSTANGTDPAKLMADGARLLIPVTSIGGRVPDEQAGWLNWNRYVGLLNDLERPTWSVITRFQVIPDPKVQVKVLFQPAEPINDPAALDVLEKRAFDAVDHLRQEPMRNSGSDDAAKGPQKRTRTVRRGAGAGKKKTAAKKKTATKAAAPAANAKGGARKF